MTEYIVPMITFLNTRFLGNYLANRTFKLELSGLLSKCSFDIKTD